MANFWFRAARIEWCGYGRKALQECQLGVTPTVGSKRGINMAEERRINLLQRKRPPKVQITYDVEVGGALEKRELSFVIGVMADLSGQPEAPLPRLKDRKFVSVDSDNFDFWMSKIRPRVCFKVDNKLAEDDSKLAVELRFGSMEDFQPQNIAVQVRPLRDLLELRGKLSDLRSSLQANDRLETLLLDTVHDTDKLKRLRAEIDRSGHEEA
jgi:type VI secretion system protein ImpB